MIEVYPPSPLERPVSTVQLSVVECSNHKPPSLGENSSTVLVQYGRIQVRHHTHTGTGAIVGDEPGCRITYRFPFHPPPSSVIPHTVFHISRVSRLCHSSAVTRQTEQTSIMSRPVLLLHFTFFFFFPSLLVIVSYGITYRRSHDKHLKEK